jgi:hypothetical protein
MAQNRSHCLICGGPRETSSDREWDRTVEAAAYEDVGHVLEKDETVMGVTRGRVMGGWRLRAVLNPRVIMTPYANLGLTSNRLIIQPILPSSGRAVKNVAASVPLADVYSLTAADADPIQPGRTVRLVLLMLNGETLRVRVNGRLATAATELTEVWRSLYGDLRGVEAPPPEKCAKCERTLDQAHRFCPYCGAAQEED